MARHSRTPHIRVTRDSVKTPRKTLRLTNLENVRLVRPGLILLVLLEVLCLGLVAAFGSILYPYEYWILICGPLCWLPLASQIGVLRLEYHGLGGASSLIGSYGYLRTVRDEIDAVLEQRDRQNHV